MRLLGWFHALMPKEDLFLDLFTRHARILVAGAEALRRLLEGGESVERHCTEIVSLEHDADDITREVLLAIRRTFVTPFDRGDIQDLITAMDDAIDEMHETAKTILLFEVHSFEPPMREMGEVIVRAANLTNEAVPLLRSPAREAGRLATIAEEITRLEGQADDFHETGLKALFRAHRHADPMAYVIGSEIYRRLERVADRFDDVGNEITGLVIEHV